MSRLQPAAPGNVIKTAPLACSAYLPHHYRQNDATFYIHAAEIRLDRRDPEVVRVLCRKAKPESVLPDSSQYGIEAPTCPECIRRLAKLGITGMGRWEGA